MLSHRSGLRAGTPGAAGLVLAIAAACLLSTARADDDEAPAEPAPAPAPAADGADGAADEKAVELERSFRIKGGAAGGEGAGPGVSHVPAVVFTEDGKTLLTATSAGDVIFWKADTRELVSRRRLVEEGGIATMAVDGKGRHLVVCFEKGGIVCLALEDGKQVARIDEVKTRAIAIARDGATVAMAVGEKVELRRVPELTLVASHEGAAGEVTDVEWSPDGARLAVADKGGKVRVVARDGALVREVKREQPVFAVAFRPDGARIAYGGHERTVTEMVIADGEQTVISDQNVQPYWITSLGYSPDGKEIAVGDESCDVWLHDIAGKKLLFHSKHHVECWLEAPAWSPDGERFVFACRPNTHAGTPAVYGANDVQEAQLAKGYQDNKKVLAGLREKLVELARGDALGEKRRRLEELIARQQKILGLEGEEAKQAAEQTFAAIVTREATDAVPDASAQTAAGGIYFGFGGQLAAGNDATGQQEEQQQQLQKVLEGRVPHRAADPERQKELDEVAAQIEQARQELLAAPALEAVVSKAAQARQAQKTAYDEALRDVKSGFNINCWKRR